MRIACIDKATATKVKSALFAQGISHAVAVVGPSVDDPTTWVVVNQTISSDKEPAIRRAIERIGNTVIHDD